MIGTFKRLGPYPRSGPGVKVTAAFRLPGLLEEINAAAQNVPSLRLGTEGMEGL